MPAGLAAAACVADVSVVLHIADLHFGTEHAMATEALLALAAREAPDLVVASGGRRGWPPRALRVVPAAAGAGAPAFALARWQPLGL